MRPCLKQPVSAWVGTTKTGRSRTIQVIPALRWDLKTWWLACGRPNGEELVFPAADGGPWDEGRYRRWRRRKFKPALEAAGLDRAIRVYDLRSTRASMLIRSGVDVVTAAMELGHSPTMLLDTYGALLDGLEKTIDPDKEIARARKSARVA